MISQASKVTRRVIGTRNSSVRCVSAVPLASSNGKDADKSFSSTDGGAATLTSSTAHPELRQVPSLPLVGSMIPQYSGIPKYDMTTQYNFGLLAREKFGDFYTIGLPGLGAGIHGTVYSIIDPREMMKVVRNEGAYPSGIVEKMWTFRRALKDSHSAMVDGDDYGLLDRGERWKKLRIYLQNGMLSPRSAKGFLPGIICAAEMASKAAPYHKKDMNQFLNYCAFDMFNSFMFGQLPGTAAAAVLDGESVNEENERFVKAALGAMECASELGVIPSEFIISEKFGLKSKRYKEFESQFSTVQSIGRKKIGSFLQRYESNELDDFEKASYLASAIERLAAEKPGGVTKEEMIELCMFALFVGVDTTSSVTAWNLMHLAMNPEVQERLHSELSSAVSENGRLDAKALSKSTSPYLHAVVRESHRITPAFDSAMWKQNSQSEIDVHGITIPKDSLVALNHISYDPTYVENARQFIPERWSPEAVNSRAGTRSELMDHPILRDPFSQGARRCPGSRVATNEILAMVAQLVLDWKFSSPVKALDDIKYDSGVIKPMIPELEFAKRL